jgi:hypothetical protein
VSLFWDGLKATQNVNIFDFKSENHSWKIKKICLFAAQLACHRQEFSCEIKKSKLFF